MKNQLYKRVLTAFLILVMAAASVRPAAATDTGIRNGEVNEYGLKKLDASSDLAKKLLYGSDANEYILGIASHFAIFTKEFSVSGNADCEGRIAADEFLLPTGYGAGYPIKGILTSASGSNQVANDGSAAIICNNSISGVFGYVQPKYSGVSHPFVVSTNVKSVTGPSAKDVQAQTYAVNANGLIDFEKEFQNLANISRKLSEQNGATVKNKYGTLELTGSNQKVNFFNVSAADFSGANTVKINVPAGSYVIINVPGKTVDYTAAWSDSVWFNGQYFGQNSAENAQVLYNFYEATKVNLKKPNRGAILAPKAFVEDQTPVNQGHIAAQIVAAKVKVNNEIGFRGFKMPKKYFKIEEAEKYTVHYLYYDAEGNLNELPGGSNGFYKLFIGKNYAPASESDAYKTGEAVCAVSSDSVKNSMISLMKSGSDSLKLYAELLENNCELRFEVYEDGKKCGQALTGSALTNKSSYAGMTRKSDISCKDTYKFASSNVYFIMYPAAKVTVDVKWDDKQDKSGKRPAKFDVKLEEKVFDPSVNGVQAKAKDSTELLSKKKDVSVEYDDEVAENITYDVYRDTYTAYVPLFGKQADVNGDAVDGRVYGSTLDKFSGENALFNINYTVPADYKDVTEIKVEKPATAGVVDKNGNVIVDKNGVVANYHIVLRGEYKASFYIIDQNGTRSEVTKDDFTDPFRGYSETEVLPSLTTREVRKVLGSTSALDEYTISWKDISKNGKTYTAGDDNYKFDYEDVVFETTLRRTELKEKSPWLYANIINFSGKHYISGSLVWQRMLRDGYEDANTADGYKFIQNGDTHYSYEALKNGEYADDKFFLLAFAFGIDRDIAKQTRVTVSTEGFGKDCKVFYEAEKNDDMMDTFLVMKEGNRKPQTFAEMVAHEDPYIPDYDGMRYFRLVLPAEEFENEMLYFTVYYIDEKGQESVWLYYTLNLKENHFWTLKK